MSNTTLYRKWRPRKFGEISGQEAVVRTLRRAIETGRVSHAYLFSGPRGTGKTSSAKVLAMGLNCLNSDGPTPEPCGECESCLGIIGSFSMDVVEMDAASNRGIDEIRDLRDRVNLAPASGRSKVYIIDEVHMLTTEAFNALLKMLEEPPEHVVFVLATTERHRVLPTIISRCQSFEFRRPGVDTLAEKLAEIAASEGIEAEPEALTIMARAGGGSFRDAEGLLDQLSSFSEGKVTASVVRELLGSAGPLVMIEVTDALAERRVADALRVLERLSGEGRDLGRFSQEMTGHLRNLVLLPHAPEVALAEVGSEEKEGLTAQSGRVPTAEAVRMIEALGDATMRIRRGGEAKLELELCFMKLARDYTEPSIEALLSRLEALESAPRTAGTTTAPNPPDGVPESEPRIEEVQPEEVQPEEVSLETGETRASGPEAEGGDHSRETEPGVDDTALVGEPVEDAGEAASTESSTEASPGSVDLAGQWGGVMSELKRRKQALTAAVYGEAKVEGFDGEILTLSFAEDQDFHVGMAKDRKHSENLLEVLSERFGVSPRIEVKSSGQPEPKGTPDPSASHSTPPVDEVYKVDEARGIAEEPPGGIKGTEGSAPARDQRPPESRADGSVGDVIRDQSEVFQMAREFFGDR